MSERPDETEGEANTDSKVGEEAPATAQGDLADAELEGVAGGFLGGLIKKASGTVKKPIGKLPG